MTESGTFRKILEMGSVRNLGNRLFRNNFEVGFVKIDFFSVVDNFI